MDWDERYRIGETPWEKGAPAPPLVDWLEEDGAVADGSRVIVPGCGTGHDAAAVKEAVPGAEVTGLDIAPRAVGLARERYGVLGCRFELGDFLGGPDRGREGGFDWMIEHTCFSAIDPSRRPDYVAAAARYLAPGGHAFAIFFLNPWDPEDGDPNQGPPFGVTAGELDRLFGERFRTVEEWRPRRAYPGREGRELVRVLRARSRPAADSSTLGTP